MLAEQKGRGCVWSEEVHEVLIVNRREYKLSGIYCLQIKTETKNVFYICYNFRLSLTVISVLDSANTILSHFKKYENHLCCKIENILLFSVSHAEHSGTCPTRTSYYEVARNSKYNFLWIAECSSRL